MPEIIPLRSIRNFRDFGGYSVGSGGRIRDGVLFRSAHFSATSDEDLDFLRSLNIGLVVDLRHGPERGRQPSRFDGAFNVLELEEKDSHQAYAPHEMFMKEALHEPEDARQYMLGSYAARPKEPVFIQAFSSTLKFMAETGEPFVIHCAAGKDRTGTLAAIIKKTLGVDDKTIMDDFMKTMEAVDIEPMLEPAAKFIGAKFGRVYNPDALRPMFGVEPEYLLASLETIGDFDQYLSETLQISDTDRNRIISQYTV